MSGETLPVVFGHEFSGVVTELGEGVDHVAVGDSVAVEPYMVCGECPRCQEGRYNLCEKMGFIGISGRGGPCLFPAQAGVFPAACCAPSWQPPLPRADGVEPRLYAIVRGGPKGVPVEWIWVSEQDRWMPSRNQAVRAYLSMGDVDYDITETPAHEFDLDLLAEFV